VLDTVKGCGAAGMVVEVHRAGEPLAVKTLDDAGRAELLQEIIEGSYEILFHVSDYQGGAFYDVIPVRFNIKDATAHYHIPLILSAFGYSTYRGG
jgi:5-hydroxyisourate hydrolase